MARIATLNNNTNDDNDDSILPNEFPIAERVSIARRQQPFKSNENIIYWEAQGKDRMCALHCLNTLLQGPVFTEADLSTVALHLDEEERKLIYDTPGSNQEISELLAGSSHNAADDGFFSITVLEQCLRRNNISIIPSGAILTVISNPTEEEAFVCNHHEHWLSIRRLYGNWYNLDSLKPGPSHVGEFYLSAILYNLIEQGYSVFVIRSTSTSPLPLPNQSFLQRPLNANQFYLTDSQIECLLKLDQDYHRQSLEAETTKYGGNDNPKSLSIDQTSIDHKWPTDKGRCLNEAVQSPNESHNIATDDDPELAEAIRLSMVDFIDSLPQPPPEPEIGSPEALCIQIRLPNQQRIVRRFNDTDHVESIFHWIELQQQSVIASNICYQLVAEYPRRLLRRIGRQGIDYESANGEVESKVDNKLLKDVLVSKQESFMLQWI